MKLERFAALIDHLAAPVTVDEAYRAGHDCGVFGPDALNCSVRFFSRPELTAAWERGKADAAPAKP